MYGITDTWDCPGLISIPYMHISSNGKSLSPIKAIHMTSESLV